MIYNMLYLSPSYDWTNGMEGETNAFSVFYMSKIVSIVMEGVFLFVYLNGGKYCFSVSPLWCGACSLPITQLRWYDVIEQHSISVNVMKLHM